METQSELDTSRGLDDVQRTEVSAQRAQRRSHVSGAGIAQWLERPTRD